MRSFPIPTALVAVFSLSFLGGCATPGDSASHATLASPASINGALSQGQSPWPQEQWWTAFGDPQLNRLIATALAGSPSLRGAQARVAQAQALADSANSLAYPTVAANLEITRQRFTETGAIPPPLAGTTRNSGQVTLDFAYDFDFWGRNREVFAAALSKTRAAEAEGQGARLVLAAAVAQSYVRLERLYTLLDVARDQGVQRERLLQLNRKLLAAGLVAESDVAGADSAAAASRLEVQSLEEQLALQGHQLAALAGQGPDYAATLGRPQLQDSGTGVLPTVLPADLLGRRPDLVAARWRVEAARGSAAAARAQFYPNVNLLAFVGYSSIGLGQLLKAASGIAGLGPAVSLPLFDGGRLRANLDGAHADQDVAIEQYNQSLLEAVREVADQATSLSALAGQAKESGKALAQASRARELARTRFQAGLASEPTALAADNAWLERRRAEADLLDRQREARIGLIKALGGGYAAVATNQSPLQQSASRNEQQ